MKMAVPYGVVYLWIERRRTYRLVQTSNVVVYSSFPHLPNVFLKLLFMFNNTIGSVVNTKLSFFVCQDKSYIC